MPRPRMPQELRAEFDATADGVRRERILAEILRRARTAPTLYSATTIRNLFPVPEVIRAVEDRWRPRLDAVETFDDYLEGLEAWLAGLDSATRYHFPVELYPSRLAVAVRAWSRGKGPVSPDVARARVVEAQRAILPTV